MRKEKDRIYQGQTSLCYFSCHAQIKTSSQSLILNFSVLTNCEQVHDIQRYSIMCKVLEFPGGKVKFTSQLSFIPDREEERIPCFRVLDDNGRPCMYNNFTQVIVC